MSELMPNKSYKLYDGSVLMTFEFYNKIYNTFVKVDSKVIITYYVNEIKQMYGRIKEFKLKDSLEYNDRLSIVVNNVEIPFASIISINTIEVKAENEDKNNVTPPELPLIISSLKDLVLSDMSDLYAALNAEEAFREIATKVKQFTNGNVSETEIAEIRNKLAKIIEAGSGTKYLSDDGSYKEIIIPDAGTEIDDLNLNSLTTTLSSIKILSEINSAITDLIGTSPDLLNTLEEISNALANDPNFATTMMNLLGDKVDKVAGKGLSTNDYTTEEKNKVTSLDPTKLNLIDNTGLGTKYLSDDGSYKEVAAGGGSDIDDLNLSSTTTTLSAYKIIYEISERIAALIGSSPDLLNTLDELSNALGDDPNFATTMMNLIGDKVSKVAGMGLSSNDYTTEEKTKVAKIIATGLGTKYLSDDGSYKEVTGGGGSGAEIDDINLSSLTTTLSAYKIVYEISERIAALVGSSPDLLNTLDELSNALGDDPNFATTITALIGDKVSKEAGKGLSTNDYITEDKTKVGLINNTGLGTKYLSDDGTYKEVVASVASEIDDANLNSTTTTLSSQKIASEIAVKISALVGSSPDLLNTLDELSNALGDDPNFATTITALIGDKVSKVAGMGLSSNDYTTEEKNKVAKIIATGLGTKYLSDDGTYKEVTASGGAGIDDTNLNSTESTLSSQKISEEYVAKDGTKVLSDINYTQDDQNKVNTLINYGDGTKYLSDDGTYKVLSLISDGNTTILSDVEDRVTNLESQTKLMSQNFIDSFDNEDHIDTEKTTAIISNGKVTIAKQGVITDLLDDNTKMDVDNSYAVKLSEGSVQIVPGQSEGVFITKEFETSGTDTVQLDTLETHQTDGAFINPIILNTGYVSKSIVDRTNRLWTFYYQPLTTGHSKLYYRVQNEDGTDLVALTDTGIYPGTEAGYVRAGSIGLLPKTDFIDLVVDYNNSVWLLFPYMVYGTNYGASLRIRKCNIDGTIGTTNIVNSPTILLNATFAESNICAAIDTNNNLYWSFMLINAVNNTSNYSGIVDCNTLANIAPAAVSVVGSLYPGRSQEMIVSNDGNVYLVHFYSNAGAIKIYNMTINSGNPVMYTDTVSSFHASTFFCGAIYSPKDNSIVIITQDYNTGKMRFEKISIATWTRTVSLLYSTLAMPNPNSRANLLLDSDDTTLYVILANNADNATYLNSRYMTINILNGSIIRQDSSIYPSESVHQAGRDNIFLWNNKIYFQTSVENNKFVTLEYNANVSTSVEYFASNDGGLNYYPISVGVPYTFSTVNSRLKLKMHLIAPVNTVTPSVQSYSLQEWISSGPMGDVSGDLISDTLPVIQNSGKCNLSASIDLNGGTIDWFISTDGGTTWSPITLNSEFTFNGFVGANIKIKAHINSPASATYSPMIYSYILNTSAIVLHSDIESIRLDLMKTNFKLDSYTNATRNSFLRMIIDTFNDTTGIDNTKSLYSYDDVNNLVSGTRIVSIADDISIASTSLLFTADEILNSGTILYYVSKDNGTTWLQIYKNVLNDISSLDSGIQLVVKAEFTGDAKLNAWSYAWN